MKKFFLWIASCIEDKSGSVSSKRVGFFWCLFMLQRISQIPTVNELIVWAVVGLAFGLAGLTIPEWFSNIKTNKNENSPSDPLL